MQTYEYEARAMGVTVSATIVAEQRDAADAAWKRMYKEIQDADARFSRFKPDSELSRLNEAGSMEVSRQMREILLLGKELYRKTEGVFTMLADISRFGYDDDIEHVRRRERHASARTPYTTDVSSIVIDEHTSFVSLPAGARVDVGGFLKGHLAEQLAKEANVSGTIVNLGGDLYVRGRDEEGEPFTLSLEDPRGGELVFVAKDGAIATSGTYRRRWTLDGAPMHHILRADGEGNPVTDLVSATVSAPSGADAEAYSTAAIVLGSVRAERFLTSRGVEYVLIRRDGTMAASPHFVSNTALYA
jgi:thiamine biosynthesis lipoprotein